MPVLWPDQLRIELSGGVYHVTSRGDGRDDIYLSGVPSSAIQQARHYLMNFGNQSVAQIQPDELTPKQAFDCLYALKKL